MNKTSGSIKTKDKDGNEVEEFLFTYSDEERETNDINRENAKLVFSPKFIPFYPKLMDLGTTYLDCILYGFIDFYTSNSTSGKFYFTNLQLSSILSCSEKTISRSVKNLETLNLVKISRKVKAGGGQIRFVRLDKNDQSSGTLVTSLAGHLLPTNNNKINKNKIKEISKQAVACSPSVNKILDIFYEINPSLNYGNTTQRKAVDWFIKKWG
jgi:hypothetical protein